MPILGLLAPLFSAIVPSLVQTIAGVFGIDLNSEENRAKKLDAESLVQQALLGMPLEQLEVNKIEAAHESIFVAGWRPAVGWVCVFGAAYAWILSPLFNYFAALAGHPGLPPLEIGSMMTVLLGMLGMGGLRTYEKISRIGTRDVPLSMSRK